MSTMFSVTVCLGPVLEVYSFSRVAHNVHTIHLTTLVVSVTDLETLMHPSPHAIFQHELNK